MSKSLQKGHNKTMTDLFFCIVMHIWVKLSEWKKKTSRAGDLVLYIDCWLDEGRKGRVLIGLSDCRSPAYITREKSVIVTGRLSNDVLIKNYEIKGM